MERQAVEMSVVVIEGCTTTDMNEKINNAIKGRKVIDIKFAIDHSTYHCYKALIMLCK